MTTLQIVSDLHIEYNNDLCVDPLTYITPSADILIMAGDIGSLYKYDQLFSFIRDIVPHFKHVLYVPGNHEYYIPVEEQVYKPMYWFQMKQLLEQLDGSFTNFNVLDRGSVQIGDLCIAGTTLWSDIKCELPKFIVKIHGMTTEFYKTMYENDLKYITEIINHCNSNNLKLVCVTHHPPTYQTIVGSKKRKRFISLYASDLDYLLESKNIDTWICGHVHLNFDFVSEGGCRVVGNQKGKPKDSIIDYKKDFIITK